MNKITGFLSLILSAVIALSLLASCTPEPPVENDPAEDYIYLKGAPARIVYSAEAADYVAGVNSALLAATGKMPGTASDSSDAASHEIILGSTARNAGVLAAGFINSLNSDKAVWCIYAYNHSLAVVWNNPEPSVIDEAIGYLVNEIIAKNESYRHDNGVVKYGEVDLTSAEAAREAAKRESQLQAIAEKLGAEAAEAMREYLTLFDEGFYIWLANLYDPETGALYYSNSGRDHEGFLPDIESTTRGYGWLASCGMLEKYDSNLQKALPDWLKEKLVTWLQNMQSPADGYFYHPQWGKDVTVNRLGRDLDNATSFLTRIGGDILYDTTNGYKGTLGLPGATSHMTTPLGYSPAAAVSAVISAAAFPDYLQDTAKFRDYILSLNWATNSYSSGNTVESQAYQIKAAGEAFVNVFKATMDEIQESVQKALRDAGKPENGLWEDNVRYNSVNGLMKIGSTYTRLGIKINYIEKAFASALEMVRLESADAEGKSATNVVDVYNPWCCLNQLISNESSFGSKTTAAALRETLTKDAAKLIRITRRKVSIFRKDDGSYGYMSVGVPDKSQGAPVAIKGTNEGDVNGGTIATTTVIGHMCGALGISTPSLYFNSDYEKFLEVIENAQPIEKLPVKGPDRICTFEDDVLGDSTSKHFSNISMGTGSIEIVEDKHSGQAARFVTLSGSNSQISFSTVSNPEASCYVFEWDMNFISTKHNTIVFQIRLGNCYMLTVHTASDGFTLGDSSSENGSKSITNSFSGKYSYGEWHTFRVEYYPGTHDTVRTLVFVDGKQVGESKNYVGNFVNEDTQPSNVYTWARFFALQAPEMTVLFDNVIAEKND